MSVKLIAAAVVSAGTAFVAGRVGLEQTVEAPPRPASLALPSFEAVEPLSLLSPQGAVEVGTPEDGFAAAVAGAALSPGQRVKTGADGRVRLRLGTASELVLDPVSELTAVEPGVFELVQGGAQIELRHPGKSITVRGAGATIEGDAADGGIARFAVVRAGSRLGAIAQEGSRSLTVTNGDARELYPAGAAGWATAKRVDAPDKAGTEPDVTVGAVQPGEELVTVYGKAEPWARVVLGSVEAIVLRDGSFRAEVPLAEAENLSVRAWTPGGEEVSTPVPFGDAAAGGDAGPPAAEEPVEEPPEEEPAPEPEPVAVAKPEPEPEPVVEKPKPTPKPKPKPKKRKRAKKKKAKAKPKPTGKGGVTWGGNKSSGGGGVTWGGKK